MRLVKASAWMIFALSCTEGPAAPVAASAPDCAEVLRSPQAPRLWAVEPDGSVVDEGPLACANCVAGSSGVLLKRTEAGLRVAIGAEQLGILVPPDSPVGTPSLTGVALGRDFLVADTGAGLRVVDTRGSLPSTLPMPQLAQGERLQGVRRMSDGGVAFHIWTPGSATVRTVFPGAPPDLLAVTDDEGRVFARLDANPPTAVTFESGERVALPPLEKVDGAWAVGGAAMLSSCKQSMLVWADGTMAPVPQGATLLQAKQGGVFFLGQHTRRLWRFDGDAPGHPKVELLAPDAVHDLAGAPLPTGAVVRRTLAVSDRAHSALVVERVDTPSCMYEDRAYLVDLRSGAVKTVSSGPGMRMHPTFGNGRLWFVEANVELSSP